MVGPGPELNSIPAHIDDNRKTVRRNLFIGAFDVIVGIGIALIADQYVAGGILAGVGTLLIVMAIRLGVHTDALEASYDRFNDFIERYDVGFSTFHFDDE